MKRSLCVFALCLINMVAIAQIAPIKTESNPREMMCISEVMYLYRTKANNNYVMELSSSNNYEETIATLNLGKGAVQALNSLVNLRQATLQYDSYFTVEGYTFYADYEYSRITSGPGMQYTAGQYEIRDCDIDNAVICMLYKLDRTSECELWVNRSHTSFLRLNIVVPKYNIKCGDCSLEIDVWDGDLPEQLQRATGKLSDEQLIVLKDAINANVAYIHSCGRSYDIRRESQYIRFMFNKILGLPEDK